MIGDDNFCQEIVGTKSGLNIIPVRNVKMKLWRKKVMKHIKDEVVE